MGKARNISLYNKKAINQAYNKSRVHYLLSLPLFKAINRYHLLLENLWSFMLALSPPIINYIYLIQNKSISIKMVKFSENIYYDDLYYINISYLNKNNYLKRSLFTALI